MAITGHMLITGAIRGIGLELTRQAAAAGVRVTALVRRPAEATALHALAEASPAITVLAGDVTDPASLALAAASVADPVDLLVCNAGQFQGRGRLGEPGFERAAWEGTLMTNVAGVFFTVEAFIAHLRRAEGGAEGGAKIAVISSIMASSARAPGGSYIYRASKAAATNLACNLATDLAAEGIAVGAYHPGWVQTDMGARLPISTPGPLPRGSWRASTPSAPPPPASSRTTAAPPWPSERRVLSRLPGGDA